MATLIIQGRIQDVFATLIKHTGIHLGLLTRNPQVTDFIRSIESGQDATITFDEVGVEFHFQPSKGLFWKKVGTPNWSLAVSM